MKKYDKCLVALMTSTCLFSMVGCAVIPNEPDNYIENKKVNFNVSANWGEMLK